MIRPIHPIGPAVGAYVCGADTDIRQTFARVRVEQLAARELATGQNCADLRDSAPEQSPPDGDDTGIEVIELFGPDDLSPGLFAVLTDTGAVFA